MGFSQLSDEENQILATPQTGDIILVDGNSKLSDSLILAQKTIYSKCQSSHVELMIADGAILHATGDQGVHLAFLFDELKTCKPNWRVMRHKKIINQENFDNFSTQFTYFINQTYNKGFMGNGNESTSFCSELVAKCYEKVGFSIFEQRPSKVAPAHFDKIFDSIDENSDWVDVTDDYKKYIDLITNKDDLRWINRFAYATLKTGLFKRSLLAPYRESSFAAMYEMAKELGSSKMLEVLEQSRDVLKNKRNLSFWNEQDYNFGLRPAPDVNILDDYSKVHHQIYKHMMEALKED